jgi:TM2 domain-containing membrane protein YozV
MKRQIILLFLLVAMSQMLHAQHAQALQGTKSKMLFREMADGSYELRRVFSFLNKADSENPRMMAIALDITLGVLGVHRLYLGTDLKVPIFYTLSLGGGGVLWLVDLGLLIANKDISKYYNNPKLFMWTN